MLTAFAHFLNLLDGSYISAEDIGITLEDIQFISKHSHYVFDNVDPGPYTAKGLFYSMTSAINIHLSENIKEKILQFKGPVVSDINLLNIWQIAAPSIYIRH